MVNYAPFATPLPEIDTIRSEINSFLFNFLNVSTPEEAINAVLENHVRVMIYRSMPNYSLPYITPSLYNNIIYPLSMKYGDIIDSSIWAYAPMSLTPVLRAADDRKVNLLIPTMGMNNIKIQWYDYSGGESINTSTNNGTDMVNIYLPDNPSLLVKSSSVALSDVTWNRVDKYHNMLNWSNDLCIYMSMTFENQDLIEQELLSV